MATHPPTHTNITHLFYSKLNNLIDPLSDYPTTNDYLLVTTHKARLPLM